MELIDELKNASIAIHEGMIDALCPLFTYHFFAFDGSKHRIRLKSVCLFFNKYIEYVCICAIKLHIGEKKYLYNK